MRPEATLPVLPVRRRSPRARSERLPRRAAVVRSRSPRRRPRSRCRAARPGRSRRPRAPPRPPSSSSRCWGSIASASRGPIPKKAGSNSAASSRKPPWRRVGWCRRARGRGRRGARGPSRGRRETRRSRRSPPATSSPELLGGGDSAGVAAADRRRSRSARRSRVRRSDRDVVADLARRPGRAGGPATASGVGWSKTSVAAQAQARRPGRAGCAARPRRGESKPSSLKAAVGVDRLRRGMAEDGGGVLADERQDSCLRALPRAVVASAAGEGAARGLLAPALASGPGPRTAVAARPRGPEGTAGRLRRPARRSRGNRPWPSAVEQLEALLARRGPEPCLGEAGAVGLGELGGQLALALPEPPGDRGGGQAFGVAAVGERVEEGVGGGVVGLAGVAESWRRPRRRGRRRRGRDRR